MFQMRVTLLSPLIIFMALLHKHLYWIDLKYGLAIVAGVKVL